MKSLSKIKFKLFFLFAWILLANTSFSQIKVLDFKTSALKSQYLSNAELKEKFINSDFSKLWTKTENRFVYGFIGDNYQRIRMKFISIAKDSSGNYVVRGKSMVKSNICEFKGVMTLTNIRKYKTTSYGVDDEFKGKGIVGQYAIIGEYTFQENVNQLHSGAFKGTFKTGFYLTKDGKIHYDNIDMNADGYSNNEFVGVWASYTNKVIKICNWGDYRIPNSGHFDIGAGEFSPADKYLPFGWQTVRDANTSKAQKEEKQIWWK